MDTRERLHALVEELPEEVIARAERALNGLKREHEEFRAYLDGLPYADEPLSPQEIESILRRQEGERRGVAFSHEQMVFLIEVMGRISSSDTDRSHSCD